MIIGVPKEIKDHETRVGLIPGRAHALIEAGHAVLVEKGAGAGSSLPAAVPHTSTFALNNATFPYLLELCNAGFRGACEANPAIYAGVNTYRGHITCPAVTGSQGRPHAPLRELL